MKQSLPKIALLFVLSVCTRAEAQNLPTIATLPLTAKTKTTSLQNGAVLGVNQNKKGLIADSFAFRNSVNEQEILYLFSFENGRPTKVFYTDALGVLHFITHSASGQLLDSVSYKTVRGQLVPSGAWRRYYSNGKPMLLEAELRDNYYKKIEFAENGVKTKYVFFKYKNDKRVLVDTQIVYTKKGDIKQSLVQLQGDTFVRKNFNLNGEVQDSSTVTIEGNNVIPFGSAYTYYLNGAVESIKTYQGSTKQYEIQNFKPNGRCKDGGGFPNGNRRYYNRRGKLRAEGDFMGGQQIRRKEFKEAAQRPLSPEWAQQINAEVMRVTQAEKVYDISRGTMLSGTINKQYFGHLLVQGFIHHAQGDSVLLSLYHYNPEFRLQPKSKMLLLDSVFLMPIKQIDTLWFSKHYYSNRLRNHLKILRNSTAISMGLTLFNQMLRNGTVPWNDAVTGIISAAFIQYTLRYYASFYLRRATIRKKILVQRCTREFLAKQD